jgi:precorrin-6B methylase 2
LRLSLRGILILFISDITVFYQVLLVQSYKIKINTEPKFILDCGANIGSSSVFFVNLFPLAQIIAVEPELENFKILVKNAVPHNNIILVN